MDATTWPTQHHDADALAGLIDGVVVWFRRHPSYADLKRLFTELARQAMDGFGAPATIPDDLVEMRTMLATLGESWKQQWLAEGEARGEAKALLRLAEKRFGPLSADRRMRILSADAVLVEAWLDHLMEAPTLEALFDTPN